MNHHHLQYKVLTKDSGAVFFVNNILTIQYWMTIIFRPQVAPDYILLFKI